MWEKQFEADWKPFATAIVVTKGHTKLVPSNAQIYLNVEIVNIKRAIKTITSVC